MAQKKLTFMAILNCTHKGNMQTPHIKAPAGIQTRNKSANSKF